MSERTEIEVLVPVERPPTRAEQRDLVAIAFDEARRLVAPHGGQVLGLVASARAVTVQGDLAAKFRFAALVPEKVTERPKVIAVPRSIGKEAS